MKTKMFQTKRRAQSGFRLLQAKTRKRKQRVTAAASGHDFAVEEPNLGVARALVVILLLHLVAIGAIVVHHNTTKGEVAENGPSVSKKSLAAATTKEKARPQIGPNDRYDWVVAGDTYERIGRKHNVDVAQLRRLNENLPLVSGVAYLLPPEQVATPAAMASQPAASSYNEQLPPIREVPARSGIPAEYEVVAAAEAIAPVAVRLPVEQAQPQEVARVPVQRVVNTPAPAPVQEAPKPAATKRHTIKSGDSLWSIAKRNGISLAALERANPGISPRKMKIGAKVIIPAN